MTAIDDAVNEYKQKATQSLEVYANLAKRAAERLTPPVATPANQPPGGNPPPPPPTWMDDIVTFWTTAGQDALNLLSLQQKLAAEAMKK